MAMSSSLRGENILSMNTVMYLELHVRRGDYLLFNILQNSDTVSTWYWVYAFHFTVHLVPASVWLSALCAKTSNAFTALSSREVLH